MIPLSDTQGTKHLHPWTKLIILINILVFLYLYFTPEDEGLIEQYALIPAWIDFNNFQTLIPFISSQFLHGGFLHIISNMWFLWIFGDNVEEKFGFLFPIIYLFSGVVGAFIQYLFMVDSFIPMLGASGAVAGILGAYFVFFPKHKIKTLIPIFGFFTITEIPASIMLIYWFVLQIFSGSASLVNSSGEIGGVAYFAHIGGFLAGFILAKIFSLKSAPVLERVE